MPPKEPKKKAANTRTSELAPLGDDDRDAGPALASGLPLIGHWPITVLCAKPPILAPPFSASMAF